jgi:DNA-binding NtrC family response regulator
MAPAFASSARSVVPKLAITMTYYTAECRPHILVVENEPPFLEMLRFLFEEVCDVTCAPDAAAARTMLESGTVWDAVLIATSITKEDALTFVRYVRTRDANLEVVLIHTYWGAQEAMELGVSLFLTTPFRFQEVRVLLQQAVARTAHRRQNPVPS